MRTCSWKEILRRNTFKYWISLDGNTNILTSNKWILSVLCTFNYSLRIAAPLGLGWKVLNCPPPPLGRPFPPQRGPKTSAPGLTSLPSPPLLLWSITTPLVWKSEEDSIWKSIAYQHWKGVEVGLFSSSIFVFHFLSGCKIEGILKYMCHQREPNTVSALKLHKISAAESSSAQ